MGTEMGRTGTGMTGGVSADDGADPLTANVHNHSGKISAKYQIALPYYYFRCFIVLDVYIIVVVIITFVIVVISIIVDVVVFTAPAPCHGKAHSMM